MGSGACGLCRCTGLCAQESLCLVQSSAVNSFKFLIVLSLTSCCAGESTRSRVLGAQSLCFLVTQLPPLLCLPGMGLLLPGVPAAQPGSPSLLLPGDPCLVCPSPPSPDSALVLPAGYCFSALTPATAASRRQDSAGWDASTVACQCMLSSVGELKEVISGQKAVHEGGLKK